MHALNEANSIIVQLYDLIAQNLLFIMKYCGVEQKLKYIFNAHFYFSVIKNEFIKNLNMNLHPKARRNRIIQFSSIRVYIMSSSIKSIT